MPRALAQRRAERLRILPPQLWSSMTSLIVPAGEDVPEGVATQVERMHYLSEKLIDKVADEDENIAVAPREC